MDRQWKHFNFFDKHVIQNPTVGTEQDVQPSTTAQGKPKGKTRRKRTEERRC